MSPHNSINVALTPSETGGLGQSHNTHNSLSRLKVIVRMDFLERGSDYTPETLPSGLSNTNHDEVRFSLVSNSAKKIINAKVILNTGITALTNNDGVAELDITGLSGEYTISIKTENARYRPNPATPTMQCIDHIAGPQLAEDNNESQYDLIFRPVQIRVTLQNGVLERVVDPFRLPENAIPYGYTHARIGNRIHDNFIQGDVQRGVDPVLPVDLRPAWFKSNAPHIQPRNNNYIDITHIVVHCTGGLSDSFGSAINTAVGGQYCAHYYMDLNGHITKVVPDKQACPHAGASRWAGNGGVNAYSIGIEILNKKRNPGALPRPYTEPQYIALIKFLSDLQSAYNLVAKKIVGHCDIKVKSRNYLSNNSWVYDFSSDGRKTDPGQHFNWERLENAGLGMRPNGQADLTTAYGGFFQVYPNERLNNGDNDQNRRFGGETRGSEVSGNPIASLQNDLENIGYSLGPRNQATGARPNAGNFDDHTKRAVERFQLHFLSGDRTHPMHDPLSAPEGRNARYLGKVDSITARLIKQVLNGT